MNFYCNSIKNRSGLICEELSEFNQQTYASENDYLNKHKTQALWISFSHPLGQWIQIVFMDIDIFKLSTVKLKSQFTVLIINEFSSVFLDSTHKVLK